MKLLRNPLVSHELAPPGASSIRAARLGPDYAQGKHDLGAPHRDAYFVLLVLTKGAVQLQLDFVDTHLMAPALLLMRPGQVHYLTHACAPQGYVVNFYPTQLTAELSQVLESQLLATLSATGEAVPALLAAAELLVLILAGPPDAYRLSAAQAALTALLTLCLGLADHAAANLGPLPRVAFIEQQFKRLVQLHYKEWKKPAPYAQQLHLTPAYLNEVLQGATGQSASTHLQQRVVLEAKRLLAFTELSMQAISAELGYEDPNYFTRLFRKLAQQSPREFRAQYRDSC